MAVWRVVLELTAPDNFDDVGVKESVDESLSENPDFEDVRVEEVELCDYNEDNE
jgi:hypothetical protein